MATIAHIARSSWVGKPGEGKAAKHAATSTVIAFAAARRAAADSHSGLLYRSSANLGERRRTASATAANPATPGRFEDLPRRSARFQSTCRPSLMAAASVLSLWSRFATHALGHANERSVHDHPRRVCGWLAQKQRNLFETVAEIHSGDDRLPFGFTKFEQSIRVAGTRFDKQYHLERRIGRLRWEMAIVDFRHGRSAACAPTLILDPVVNRAPEVSLKSARAPGLEAIEIREGPQ
jgi:hypothetical protein